MLRWGRLHWATRKGRKWTTADLGDRARYDERRTEQVPYMERSFMAIGPASASVCLSRLRVLYLLRHP
jgi:hypothetical protein